MPLVFAFMPSRNTECEPIGNFLGDIFGHTILWTALITARFGLRLFSEGKASKTHRTYFDTVSTDINLMHKIFS